MENFDKSYRPFGLTFEKARAGLTAKKVSVARGGKTFQQTVYVRAGEKKKEAGMDVIRAHNKRTDRITITPEQKKKIFSAISKEMDIKPSGLMNRQERTEAYTDKMIRAYENKTIVHPQVVEIINRITGAGEKRGDTIKVKGMEYKRTKDGKWLSKEGKELSRADIATAHYK